MAQTKEDLEARVKELESQLADKNTLSYKVSQKGAVSVYGLGRFPVTLYKEQWERLLDQREALLAFITANDASLTKKH